MQEIIEEKTPETKLEQIGHLLKSTREEKNYTLEQVANTTRINIQILKEIEEGSLEHSPGTAFVRGFIRSYCELLGLDSKPILEDLKSLPEFQASAINEKGVLLDPIKEDRSSGLNLVWLLLFLLLLGGGYLVYLNFDKLPFIGSPTTPAEEVQTTSAPSTTVAQATTVEDPPIQNTVTAPAEPSPEVTTPPEPTSEVAANADQESPEPVSNAPSENEVEFNTPSNNNELTPTTPSAQETITPPPEPTITTDIAEIQESLLPGTLTLLIKAKTTTWLEISGDNNDPLEVSLQANEEYTLDSQNQFKLTIGNTKGVDVFLNEKTIPLDTEKELLVNWIIDKTLLEE